MPYECVIVMISAGRNMRSGANMLLDFFFLNFRGAARPLVRPQRGRLVFAWGPSFSCSDYSSTGVSTAPDGEPRSFFSFWGRLENALESCASASCPRLTASPPRPSVSLRFFVVFFSPVMFILCMIACTEDLKPFFKKNKKSISPQGEHF